MTTDALRPSEGLGVLHLFFRVDATQRHHWTAAHAGQFAAALQRWHDELQLHVFSTFGHKADVMVMAITDDLESLRRLQTDLVATGAPALALSWSYLSLTEGSEYMQSADEYREELATKGVTEPDLSRRTDEFAERMTKYTHDKLYPQMPAWELACFYPMSHRRDGDDNWYSLDFAERRRLMHEHGRSGRAYTGRVIQLVSGSTGLDDWEWGVTLFAHDLADLKSIVYQLRYDEASARFAEFGPFVVGIRRTPDELVADLGPHAT